ncbi:MAG: PilZ domain-containing protein [Candidatus Omnitrophota bacterium]
MLEKREAYKYRALKQDGELIEGIVYALNQQEAFAKILEQGYTPEIIEKTELADQRAYERKQIELDFFYSLFGQRAKIKLAAVSVDSPVFKANFFGITQNISAGGLLFNTPRQLNIGTIINVTLELPDEDAKIYAQCRVIRCYEIEQDIKYEIAVCFSELPEQGKKILNSKIRKISRHFDRRAYERFNQETKLYFDFHKLEQVEEKPQIVEKENKFAGKTIDLSAGGMFFSGALELKKDQVIELEIRFETEKKTIQTLGKVVRSIEVPNSNKMLFHTAVFFLNISNSDKNWLNRYVMDYNG